MFQRSLEDVRLACRALLRRPAVTLLAVLTLSLGLGAGTLVFSVTSHVLLNPLPYDEPGRLVMMWNRFPRQELDRAAFSGPEIMDLRELEDVFQGVAAIWQRYGSFGDGEGDPEQVHIGWVTHDFFPVLGASPALGRHFEASDDVRGAPPVILLSHRIWSSRYASDPDIVGKSVLYNGEPITVVGVMPKDFRVLLPADASIPSRLDAWLPWGGGYEEMSRGFHRFSVIGRLRPGVSLQEARQQVAAMSSRVEAEEAAYTRSGYAVDVEPLHGDLVAPVRQPLMALIGTVFLVLLIACANVANLLLVRAASRESEIALRAALGASRFRLLRLFWTESLILAAVSCALAASLVWAGLLVIRSASISALPRPEAIEMNWTVLAFALGASLLSSLVFGSAPALQGARVELVQALKQGTRSSRGMGLMRKGILGIEMALCVLLLIGAGLLLRSFDNLRNVDGGVHPHNVLTLKLSLPFTRYFYSQPVPIIDFYKGLSEAVSEMPGVRTAGLTNFLPLSGVSNWEDPYSYDTPDGPLEWGAASADYRIVTPEYLSAVGTRLLQGRFFDRQDDLEHPLVALVDEELAARAWPDESPLGQRLRVNRFLNGSYSPEWAQVVGVVESVRSHGLEMEAVGTLYLPHAQSPLRSMALAVQTEAGASQGLVESIREAVLEQDALLPIFDVLPMQRYMEQAQSRLRLVFLLVLSFALLALTLAAAGTYGVMSFIVRNSTREIGIRAALGADRLRILRWASSRCLVPAFWGIAAGAAAAFLLGMSFSDLLFQVSPGDPMTYVACCLLALTVALAATFRPALRAASIHPSQALRSE
ncbi:MAG TPA: ABC transporter permease [Acidobacteriota bacterium]|nr:ABC transporter permease [Acidobacteriota bacterium]